VYLGVINTVAARVDNWLHHRTSDNCGYQQIHPVSDYICFNLTSQDSGRFEGTILPSFVTWWPSVDPAVSDVTHGRCISRKSTLNGDGGSGWKWLVVKRSDRKSRCDCIESSFAILYRDVVNEATTRTSRLVYGKLN
jgi:hypothetical protein